MKPKKIIYLTIGIFTLILGLHFSFIQYNPTEIFGTVHEFSYACLVQDPILMEVYSSAYEGGMCTHNETLSTIVFSMVGFGIFLIAKSIKRR